VARRGCSVSPEKSGTLWVYDPVTVTLPEDTQIVSGVAPLAECTDGVTVKCEGKPYWLVRLPCIIVDGVSYGTPGLYLLPRSEVKKEHAWEEVDPSVERVHFKNDMLRVFVCSKCGRRNLEEQILHSGGCSGGKP
jgi:hypothetical protein